MTADPVPSSRSAFHPEEESIEWARTWLRSTLEPTAAPPFGFAVDGVSQRDLWSGWRRQSHDVITGDRETTHRLTWSHPGSNLRVTCELTAYDAESAVEWIVHIHNAGEALGPLLTDLDAADLTLTRDDRPDLIYPANEFRLHWMHGCRSRYDDFMPEMDILAQGHPSRIGSLGGRSSSGDDGEQRGGALPFFNIDAVEQGVIAAVGWSGQWQAKFDQVRPRELNVKIGFPDAAIRLNPGESVRLPRVLLYFWKNQRETSHNLFRQFLLPRTNR
jgi:alpha-galactosidase